MENCVVEGCKNFVVYYVANQDGSPITLCEEHTSIFQSATEAGLTLAEAVKETQKHG